MVYFRSFSDKDRSFAAICGLGFAPNATNTSQCIECDFGYFSSVNGSDPCTICPNNFTTPTTASTSADDCYGKYLEMYYYWFGFMPPLWFAVKQLSLHCTLISKNYLRCRFVPYWTLPQCIGHYAPVMYSLWNWLLQRCAGCWQLHNVPCWTVYCWSWSRQRIRLPR